jgi:hypothetical protein
MRIFLGHQSVGADIVRGLGELPAIESAAALRICDKGHIDELPPGSQTRWLLVHTPIGRNRDPLSKLDEFERLLRGELAQRVDLALCKFCYVDVTAATAIDELFAVYHSRMQELAAAIAPIRIAHITIPLRAVSAGWRARLSRALGRRDPELAHNRAREDFNRRLRQAFPAALFDLAAVESGQPEPLTASDSIRSLRVDYTNDGGHLNAQGRRIAARAFLQFLESVAISSCPQR